MCVCVGGCGCGCVFPRWWFWGCATMKSNIMFLCCRRWPACTRTCAARAPPREAFPSRCGISNRSCGWQRPGLECTSERACARMTWTWQSVSEDTFPTGHLGPLSPAPSLTAVPLAPGHPHALQDATLRCIDGSKSFRATQQVGTQSDTASGKICSPPFFFIFDRVQPTLCSRGGALRSLVRSVVVVMVLRRHACRTFDFLFSSVLRCYPPLLPFASPQLRFWRASSRRRRCRYAVPCAGDSASISPTRPTSLPCFLSSSRRW